jgi:hypothetical protein
MAPLASVPVKVSGGGQSQLPWRGGAGCSGTTTTASSPRSNDDRAGGDSTAAHVSVPDVMGVSPDHGELDQAHVVTLYVARKLATEVPENQGGVREEVSLVVRERACMG